MTSVEKLAQFVCYASFESLSEAARLQLKIRVLDALGCAIGALGGQPVALIRKHLEDFGGRPLTTLIGGKKTSPDRAAFYNGALIRYLDFNDSYLAKGETCHPSDNIGALLAAAEYANRSGRDFLTALGVAYQVFCRLCDEAPVRSKGFDHTTLGSFAVAAGVSRALGLNPSQTANAIAISGTAFNALRVTRTGALSNWKGLAFPNTGFACTHATFLAMRGITGPPEVFEGNKGFMDVISGRFEIDWTKEDLERVNRTILKKYNAEIHSQSVLEAVLDLQRQAGFKASAIEGIEIEVFDVAYNIIGGGEEGSKILVRTKEEADHSLPYMVATAVLDGQVMPQQYLPEQIGREAVQTLLRKVTVRPNQAFSDRFPEEMPCRVTVRLPGGHVLVKEGRDYEGFHTRPFSWETVLGKFQRLSESYASASLRRKISEAVRDLENIAICDLMKLLAKVKTPVEGRVETAGAGNESKSQEG
ncbi:MAG: MmgE/PrpD family protein [Acidobacteria bacterium]|nr:MAG: MmgE/PrpD family protein [Acidobacteriota bacterium]